MKTPAAEPLAVNVQVDEYYSDIDPKNILVSTRSLAKNPYPGLRPFRTSESPVFFGRQEICFELIHRLSIHNFLSVIGASGTGKSSLVRAGLLPSLQSLPGKHGEWRVAICRPGNDPFGNLANAIVLGKIFKALTVGEIYRCIKESSFGFENLYGQHNSPDEQIMPFNTLMIIDQFEELFRYRKENGVAGLNDTALFIKMLIDISENKQLNTYVLLTMRSEYLDECVKIPGLAEKINTGQFLVPGLNINQLKSVIVNPLAFTGSVAEEGLDNKLIGEMNNISDPLPVLQHALRASYEQAVLKGGHSDKLTLGYGDYEAVGKMSQALNRHGDQLYDQLSASKQHYCKLLFQALTTQTSEGFGIRRPTTFLTIQKICSGKEPADMSKVKSELLDVINIFRAESVNFLMPAHPNPIYNDTEIDISHESLMRIWDKLKGWMKEESRAAVNYKKIAEGAEENADFLQGQQLVRAVSWLADPSYNEYWAKRYGGYDFAKVESYVKKSQSKEVTKKRLNKLFYYVFPVITLFMIIVYAYSNYQDRLRSLDNLKAAAASKEKTANQLDSSAKIQIQANARIRASLDSLKKEQLKNHEYQDALARINHLVMAQKNTLDSLAFNRQPFYVSPLLDNNIKTDVVTKLLLPLKRVNNEKKISAVQEAVNKSISAYLTSFSDPNLSMQLLFEAQQTDNNVAVKAITDSVLTNYLLYQQATTISDLSSGAFKVFSNPVKGKALVKTYEGFGIADFSKGFNFKTPISYVEAAALVKSDTVFAFPDENHIVYYVNNTLATFNLAANEAKPESLAVKNHGGVYTLSPDGKIFCTSADNDRNYRVFKKGPDNNWQEITIDAQQRNLQSQQIILLSFSPDSKCLSVGWKNGDLTIVDTRTGTSSFIPVKIKDTERGTYYLPVTLAGMDMSNDMLATFYSNGTAEICSLKNPSSKPRYIKFNTSYGINKEGTIVRLAPDNQHILLGYYGKAVVYDISGNAPVFKYICNSIPYTAAKDVFKSQASSFGVADAVFLDNNILMVGNRYSNEIRIYDLTRKYTTLKEAILGKDRPYLAADWLYAQKLTNVKVSESSDVKSLNNIFDGFEMQATDKNNSLTKRLAALKKAAAANESLRKTSGDKLYFSNLLGLRMTAVILEQLQKKPNYQQAVLNMQEVEKLLPKMGENDLDSTDKSMFYAEFSRLDIFANKAKDALLHINKALEYGPNSALARKNQVWALLVNQQQGPAEEKLAALANIAINPSELEDFDDDMLFNSYKGINLKRPVLYKTLFKRDLELFIRNGNLRVNSNEVLRIRKILG